MQAASHVLPASVAAGASASQAAAANLTLLEKPVTAAAKQASPLVGVAKVLARGAGVAAVTASTLTGYNLVRKAGVDALWETKQGRGAVLGATGGVALLVPGGGLVAAGALGATALNEFGALDWLNQSQAAEKHPERAKR